MIAKKDNTEIPGAILAQEPEPLQQQQAAESETPRKKASPPPKPHNKDGPTS